jgi:hypothetical protein
MGDWLDDLHASDFGKAIRAQCDEAEDAPAERAGEGWKGSIYGFCPVQGHGEIDGRFWYFRSRGDDWRFEVYLEPCSERIPGDEKLVWDRCGDYDGDAPNAGWMKFSEAWLLIEESVALFRAA